MVVDAVQSPSITSCLTSEGMHVKELSFDVMSKYKNQISSSPNNFVIAFQL